VRRPCPGLSRPRTLDELRSLLLAAEQDPCDDSNTSLTWFNPVTRREQMLIRTPHALAGVLGAVPYGQPLAPIFFAVGCAGASMKRAGNPGVDIADLRQIYRQI
jgi:hypothetical protein